MNKEYVRFFVYIKKHVTGYFMRYGVYETFQDAEKAIERLKCLNGVDSFSIEKKILTE